MIGSPLPDLIVRNWSPLSVTTGRREPAPIQAKDDGPSYPGIARHLAFQTDDLDAFLARVDGQIPVSLGPLHFDDFIPGWKTVWVRDPNGGIVEISQGYVDQANPPPPPA